MHLQHLSVHRKYVAALLAGVLLVALGSFVALLSTSCEREPEYRSEGVLQSAHPRRQGWN